MTQELINHLQDLLRGTRWQGRIRTKAMFGGFGVYCDGRMCAIVFNDSLYLKTDAASRAEFTRRGLTPFTYLLRGKPMPLSYYAVPAEALEDGAELADWLDRAAGAAGRKAAATAAAASAARANAARRSRPSPASSPRRKSPKAPRPKASPPRPTRKRRARSKS